MCSYQHILQHVFDMWASVQNPNQERTKNINGLQRTVGKQIIGKIVSIV